MTSTPYDTVKGNPTQDGYVAIAPRATSAKARNGYVMIAPKNTVVTSKLQPLATTSAIISTKLSTHKPRSYITRSKVRASSESMGSQNKHRSSPKGSMKTSKDNRGLEYESFDSKDSEKIPLASARWDGYIHIAPKSARTTKTQPLATPPSSVSPTMPVDYLKPDVFRSLLRNSSSECTEVNANSRKTPELEKSALNESYFKSESSFTDNLGAITPALLARYHLPGILIKHGPLAIRHIMSFLTSAVPGFSRIPPAKSRRLVVSALERQVSEYVKGEFECGVIFEKVGWGRWNARLSGRSGSENNMITYPNSPSCKSDSQIAQKSQWSYEQTRSKVTGAGTHDNSTSFSHGDDMDIDTDIGLYDIERDRISLDSHETYSSQGSIDDDELMSENSSDTTDDEDWAALGAAALRAASYSAFSHSTKYLSPQVYEDSSPAHGEPHISSFFKSSPQQLSIPQTKFTTFNMTPSSQEREAVEALMNLGSI
ncbi:putative protein stb3 [Erysiphe necator]|uniref:Sin3 binding protein n=1 Tax=Uncinula necator TaxID=52586 RepID=A0A0B1P1K3_UNCNE|nr:putative protein stb3 [Erysiphe necator]